MAMLAMTAGAQADDTTAPVAAGSMPFPVSTGKAHVCNSFYPSAEKDAHIEGNTEVTFHVTVDGTTKDAAVSKSSGNANLDAAAVTCVGDWHYKPLPMEVPQSATVYWRSRH
jgi:TonB family protein